MTQKIMILIVLFFCLPMKAGSLFSRFCDRDSSQQKSTKDVPLNKKKSKEKPQPQNQDERESEESRINSDANEAILAALIAIARSR